MGARSLSRKQDGDGHHHGSGVVPDSVAVLQERWAAGRCSVDEDGDLSDDDDDGTDLFLSPKWLSQLCLE